jgi:hypothetical protein
MIRRFFDRSTEELKVFFGPSDAERDACIEALAPYLELFHSAEIRRDSADFTPSIDGWRGINDIKIGQATSPPLVRFHLKAALGNGEALVVHLPPLETLRFTDQSLKAAVFTLLFLRTAQELPVLKISSASAQVLAAMASLEQVQGVVTQEDIENHLSRRLPRTLIKTALRFLETLGCIAIRQDEVVLKEVIVIEARGPMKDKSRRDHASILEREG